MMMTRDQLSDEIRRLMQNPRATIKQLKKLVEESKWELWWSVKKPEKKISVFVATSKQAAKKKAR